MAGSTDTGGRTAHPGNVMEVFGASAKLGLTSIGGQIDHPPNLLTVMQLQWSQKVPRKLD